MWLLHMRKARQFCTILVLKAKKGETVCFGGDIPALENLIMRPTLSFLRSSKGKSVDQQDIQQYSRESRS